MQWKVMPPREMCVNLWICFSQHRMAFGTALWLDKPLYSTDSEFKPGVNLRDFMASVGRFLPINSGRLYCKLNGRSLWEGDAHEILTRSSCAQGTTVISFDPFQLSVAWLGQICGFLKATVIIHFRARLMSSEESGESPQSQKVRMEQ